MRLRDRIDRLEALMSHPRCGDGDGVTAIIVRGGLPQPMSAYLPGSDVCLGAWDGEPLTAFRRRAIEWAGGAGSGVVIVTGVPL